MRQRLVLGILLGIFVVFGFLVVNRSGPSTPESAPPTTADAGNAGDPAGPDAADPDAAATADQPVEPEALERPIEVVSTNWELIAPGVVANGGAQPADDNAFGAAGVNVEFDAVDDMDMIRRALAKGGKADGGADVAVVALPSFVASYEKLRALHPRVFFSVGWSRGREALASSNPDGLTDAVDAESVALRGLAGGPATYFGLYLMELAGIPLDRIHLVDEVKKPDKLGFAAISPGRPGVSEAPSGYQTLITTADAPGLVTYVAIASEGFIRRHVDDLTTWATVWQQGRRKLNADVPNAARQIAGQDEALDVVDLVDVLGAIELANILDNARLSGLSGRPPLTLETQFQLAWRIWRDVGVLSTPSPQSAPIANDVVAAVARNADSADGEPARPSPGGPDGAPSTRRTLLIHRHESVTRDSRHDADEMVGQIGRLAGIFNRSAIRVERAYNKDKTQEILDQVAQRYQINPQRLLVGQRRHAEGTAFIEVFAVE